MIAERAVVLAKLLALEPLRYCAAERICGWGPETFRKVLLHANRAGLVTWHNRGFTLILRAGMTDRRLRSSQLLL